MKKAVIAMAAAVACLASTAANADTYARAYNEITNLVVTSSNSVGAGLSVNSSFATACLPNGNCVSNGGAGVTDSAPAQLGWAGYVNNSYASNAASATSYAVADASIDQLQLNGAPFTRARNFAEGKLVGNGTANAVAGNSSATLLSTTIVAGAGDKLSFHFDALPYIQAYLTSNAIAPSQAQGSIGLNFNLIDNSGNIVFNWAPDGIAGGIQGGSETADAFTLNTSLTALNGNGGPLTFAPSSCTVGGAGCFSATTNALAAGVYTLNLAMHESVTLQSAVPEADTYAMLLAGLGILGVVARRRQRANAA